MVEIPITQEQLGFIMTEQQLKLLVSITAVIGAGIALIAGVATIIDQLNILPEK